MSRRFPRAGTASAVLALVAATGTGLAAAAPLLPAAASLGSGIAVVAACTSSGTVSWTDTAGSVTAVSISGLPAGCEGAQLSLTLLSGTTDLGHGGPATVSGGTATVSGLSAAPAAAGVTRVQVLVVGP